MVALSTADAVDQTEQLPAVSAEMTNAEKKTKSEELVASGRGMYMKEEYKQAMDLFGEACQLIVEANDGNAFAVSCADAHYWYGKAGLDYSRLQRNVFVQSMKGMPLDESSTDDDEKQEGDETTTAATSADSKIEGEPLTEEQMDKIHDQVEEALAENADSLEKQKAEAEGKDTAVASEVPDDPTAAATEKTAEGEQVTAKDTTETVPDEPKDGEAEAGAEEEADGDDCDEEDIGGEAEDSMDEDTDDLQVAFESADIARKIAEQQMDVADAPVSVSWQLCDALLLVAEINIETGVAEQLDMAVTDLQRCLELQEKTLPAERRNEVAETYMSLMRAYKVKDDYETAATMVTKAITTLEEAAAYFRTQSESESADVTAECKEKAAKECERLTALAGDMASMVDDLKASAQQKTELEADKEAATSATAPSIVVTSSNGTKQGEGSAPVPEIAVRKAVKRKSTEADSTDAPATETAEDDDTQKIKRMKAAVQESTETEVLKDDVVANGHGDSVATNGNGTVAPVQEAS